MLWILLLAPAQKPVEFELEGRITPARRAAVTLYGATSPFTASTLAGPDGRFRFRKLLAGSYTVAVFMPGRGEARETIDVGPSLADARRRVRVSLNLKDAQFVEDRRRHTVSARELAIPESARREYMEAQKLLSKRDVAGATARLERAVELAPQFVAPGTTSAPSPTRAAITRRRKTISAARSPRTRAPTSRSSTSAARCSAR